MFFVCQFFFNLVAVMAASHETCSIDETEIEILIIV